MSPGHKPGGCRRGSSSSTKPYFFLASSNDHHACMVPFAEAGARVWLPDAAPMSRQTPQLQRTNLPFLHGPPLPPLWELIPFSRQLPGVKRAVDGKICCTLCLTQSCLCPWEAFRWHLWTSHQTFPNCAWSGNSALPTVTAFDINPVLRNWRISWYDTEVSLWRLALALLAKANILTKAVESQSIKLASISCYSEHITSTFLTSLLYVLIMFIWLTCRKNRKFFLWLCTWLLYKYAR